MPETQKVSFLKTINDLLNAPGVENGRGIELKVYDDGSGHISLSKPYSGDTTDSEYFGEVSPDLLMELLEKLAKKAQPVLPEIVVSKEIIL